MSLAHLAETCLNTSGHIQAHVTAGLSASGAGDKHYHLVHSDRHVDVLIEHLRKLIAHLRQDVPAVGAELDALGRVTDTSGTLPPVPRSALSEKAYQAELRRLRRPAVCR